MNKRNKHFFRKIKMDLIRFSVYFFTAFLVVLAVCFVISLPEIIGTLIFG